MAARVKAELGKSMAGMKEDAMEQMKVEFRKELPQDGFTREGVLGEIRKYWQTSRLRLVPCLKPATSREMTR